MKHLIFTILILISIPVFSQFGDSTYLNKYDLHPFDLSVDQNFQVSGNSLIKAAAMIPLSSLFYYQVAQSYGEFPNAWPYYAFPALTLSIGGSYYFARGLRHHRVARLKRRIFTNRKKSPAN